jgi:glycosyltransferase involved in cell wall biosynthesis
MLLSICIATFNRSVKLGRTLSVLTGQLASVDAKEVEIIVGDNHSEDDTEKVLDGFAAAHHFVRYIRQPTNLGAEANYRSVIDTAQGEYIWLLSDDDYILDGCVERLLRVLHCNPDVDYVFVNYELWREDESRVSGPSLCASTVDARVLGLDELYLATRFANSFISSNVYRKAAWTRNMDSSLLHTLWPQLYVASRIVEKGAAYVICEPLLRMGCLSIEASRAEKTRQGNDHFYMDAHLLYMDFVAAASERMRQPHAIALAHRYVLNDNPYQIIHYRNTALGYSLPYMRYVFARMRSYQPLRAVGYVRGLHALSIVQERSTYLGGCR